MNVAVGGLVHEANAFAPPSTMADVIVVPPEKMLRAFAKTDTEITGFLQAAGDHHVTPVGFAYGESGGMLDDVSARSLCADLVERVVAAEPDVVLLALHGSMATPGIDDVEGMLLADLRTAVGDRPTIAATLDWHCSITPAMVTAADVLVGYRTYPHIDQRERAGHAARLAFRAAAGQVTLTAASIRPPMIIAGPATSHVQSPMREVLAEASTIAARYTAVLDWSLCPGFARSDVPRAGSHVYVVTDGDRRQADECARELASLLWDRRHAFVPNLTSIDDAVQAALRAHETNQLGRPTVLADQGDNPGGGASADSTVLVDALLDAAVGSAVMCSQWDPATVDAAHHAGVGGRIDWRGHAASVLHLADGRYTMHSPTHDGVRRNVGPIATLGVAYIRVIVTTTRVQNEDLQFLDMAGVDPTSAAVLGVKSNAHFRAAFGPIASEIIDVDTPGLSTPHLERLPFRRIGRPVFPLDEFDWSPHHDSAR